LNPGGSGDAIHSFDGAGMKGTIEVYNRMADEYEDLFGESVPAEFADFIGSMAPRSRILDLGCGPGHHAARMAKAGFKVLAVDGAAEMVARAACYDGVSAMRATFDDIPTFGRVGGIWASFSLLHAPRTDLPRHLAALHAICEPGSPLFIGMKLGSDERTDRLGRHYSYYSEVELRTMLVDAGFFPGAARTGMEEGLSGDVEDWITMLAHA